MEYMDQVGVCATSNQLYQISINFIRAKFPDYRFSLYRHSLSKNPFHLVQKSNLDFDKKVFSEWASSDKKLSDAAAHYVYQDYVFFPIGKIDNSFDFYILVFDQLISAELLALIRVWSQIDSIVGHSIRANCVQEGEKQGGLISQLLHDMQSTISNIDDKPQSVELKNCIAHQRKVSDELLFYIRDVDLITASVSVKELIFSSLEFLSVDWKTIKLNISTELTNCIIDAELFSIAFTNILKNSVTATDRRLENIFVNVSKSASYSPFIPFDWIKIEVRDEGCGIHDDNFDFTRNPFFTTSKREGSAGFGLTNAEKIISAHSGFIDIISAPNTGTTVQIFIPEKL